MNTIKYTATNESIAVVINGKVTTVKRGAPNFNELRKALMEERWADAEPHLRITTSLKKWAKDRFSLVENRLMFDGQPVPDDIHSRISEMASNGEDPTPLFRFWENLQLNPSKRSVDQLWRFMRHIGIPLTSDGCFLAYKGVKNDLFDCHSGTILNAPGAVIKMQRNKISDDPDYACHVGLHVGALEYAKSFGPTVVICKVKPENVVCVPNDHSFQKMRVCEYEVVGVWSGEAMPSTTIEDSELPRHESKFDGTATKAAPTLKVPKEFKRIHEMTAQELLDGASVDDLRRYASNVLKVVNASRLPGGKQALVSEIVKRRG